jgi:hypothetical protein
MSRYNNSGDIEGQTYMRGGLKHVTWKLRVLYNNDYHQPEAYHCDVTKTLLDQQIYLL